MGKRVTIKTRPDFFKNAGAENIKVRELMYDEYFLCHSQVTNYVCFCNYQNELEI